MTKHPDNEQILEQRKLVKSQPTVEEITRVLKKVLSSEITQGEANAWACNYIVNDDLFEVTDFNAWEYLLAVAKLGEVEPNKYLYFEEDIKDWIEKHDNNVNGNCHT